MLKLPPSLLDLYGRLTTNHRKTAFKLCKAVSRLCTRYGVERIGFLTLTFADNVRCAKEAGRRFNSLATSVLRGRYAESICVLERMKSGRIHFHLLVVLGCDIRTGFDFVAAKRGFRSGANQALRAEWAFLLRVLPRHGFGRPQLEPVRSNEEGLSKYVGKYISKHVGARKEWDKGVRMVRYSAGASIGSNAFMFHSKRATLWRWQVSQFADRNGCSDLAEVREKFGSRWAYQHRSEIIEIEPPAGTKNREVWAEGRTERVGFIACNLEITFGEAAAILDGAYWDIEYTVPRWTGVSLAREAEEASWDRTVTWADGTFERGWNPARLASVHLPDENEN